MTRGLFDEVNKKIKDGGLHKQLRTPAGYKFKLAELKKINRVKEGEKFSFRDKDVKMTKLLKKRVQLAVNMMGSKR
tara:strand:- start:491 stop:718 length:228 start_codon:yes stop_codon:yes gene_type:complete